MATWFHSSIYRNPDLLRPGAVLVLGGGQSGCQIAEDLHLAGRKVNLCVGDAPRLARRYRRKDVVEWLHHPVAARAACATDLRGGDLP